MPRKPNPHKEEIIRLYKEGLSTLKIANKIGCTIGVANNIIYRSGIARSNKENSRKYTLNHNFFEAIDTEEKSYWLGFMYADGYITKNKSQKVIGLALSSKDKGHLEKFKTSLEATYPIKTYTGCTHGVETEYSRLYLTSDKMFDDLSNNGVRENKTFTVEFPGKHIVPHHLLHHFIRGYFDGDGSFSKNGDNYKLDYSIKICGTAEMLNGIKNAAGVGYTVNLLKRYDYDKNNWYLHLSKQKDVLILADIMYKDATIFLDRKYKRYEQLKRSS